MTDTCSIDGQKFLRNQWYVAALSVDIKSQPFARTICDEDIVFFRTGSGRLAALEDRCPHRHTPLSLGTVEGETIRCGYHGLVFDIEGVCMRVPGQDKVPRQATARRYAVDERDGWVWIWMGDPQTADLAAITALPYFEVAQWAGFQKYFHVRAACQLFVDNLLDLSHVPFTHAASIGAASAADASVDMQVRVDPDCVRGVRVVHDTEAGPFIGAWGNFPGRIQRHSSYTWRPPSVMEIRSHFSDANNAITIMIINPITPETATTAHFWIGWARDFRLDDAAETEQAIEQNTQVILEDVRVIEGQQLRITKNPTTPAVPIKADEGIIAVHRFLDRLYLAQQDAAVS